MNSLPNIQKRILMTLIDDQPLLEKDLHKKLKADFPDLSINELRRAIKELANDWRYIYAHETSWGYKVELNSIGESEARRLMRDHNHKNHIDKGFYHILVWPHENVLYSDHEIEADLTFEDCFEIIKDISYNKTFFLNGRKRRSDRVTRYEVYKTEKRLKSLSKEDVSIVKKSDYTLITTYGDKVTREFIRQTGPREPRKNYKRVTAFLSASFSDKIDRLILWFIKMIKSVDIDKVIWLKEKYEARPTEEKIKENIKLCNCFIQIITRDIAIKGKEAGWLGNEIAWARESSPNGNMAIFVEKGAEATGLAKVVVDNLYFSPGNLQEDAPKIIQYLNNLKEKVLSS